MISQRLYVFFASAIVLLHLVLLVQAQSSSIDNFRWLGETGLALSGQPDDSEWETARSLGINATMNLRCEWSDNETYLNSIGIEYYYLPIINNGAADSWNLTAEQNEVPIHWINSKLAEGKKVLIHCYLGQNRAPTMAMMWYIHEGHTAEEAYTWILQYPVSDPFDYQKQRAADYYDWLQLQPTPTPSPSPTPTPTPTPSPTANPEPTLTSTPSPSPKPTSTPLPTPRVTPTPTPLPSSSLSSSQPTQSPENQQLDAPEPFPTVPIVVTSVALIIVVAGLLVYFKKHKH